MALDLRHNKILVTGASGQLGQALIGQLKYHTGTLMVLDIVKRELPADGPKIIRVKASLTDTAELAKFKDELAEVDCLVHLASIIEDSRDIRRDAQKAIDIEILGMLNLLSLLPNLKGVCFASSYMVYGPTAYLPIDEEHPTEPLNIYSVCKLTAEKFLRLYAIENEVPAAALRYSGIYGPGTPVTSRRMIPSFIRRAANGEPPVIYGEGTEKRISLYIDDASAAIIRVMNNDQKNLFETYNISGGASFTAAELAQLVIKIFGEENGQKDLEIQYQKPEVVTISGLSNVEMDISKATKMIGFKPEVDLETGLRAHINWYLKQK